MQAGFYTIGYEGSRVEDFVPILQQFGIETLIDVRDVPLSRKPGFSKSALSANLQTSGIVYVHLKGLGDPKPGRLAARAGNFEQFRRIFDEHMETNAARRDLERAIELIHQRPCCLMCFEHEHCHCHRSIVADHIVERTGLPLRHISTKALSVRHEQPASHPGYAFA
jgi:uncharacterized protein (DUF488 family)